MEYITEGIVRYKAKPGYTWRNYFSWELFINHGWRFAELAAQCGSSFLFEYEMPNGNCYLYEINVNDAGEFEVIGQSINKKRLPHRWQIAEWFIDNGVKV